MVPIQTVTDYSQLNVYQKLQLARIKFLQSGVKKTGKNIHMEFMYFELEDIVPVAEPIFAEVGLLGVVNIEADTAYMRIFNVDDADDSMIEFSMPFVQIDPIVSNTGKVVTNKLQALGSSTTYIRRYLWQLALDIVETDSIDNISGISENDTPAPATQTKQMKVTSGKQREEIKKDLTRKPSDAADDLEIQALKTMYKTLIEMDPEQEKFVQEVALNTEGFTKITHDQCTAMIEIAKEMLNSYKTE